MPRKTKAKVDPTVPATTEDTPITLPAPETPPHNIFNQDGELVIDVFETHQDFVVLAAIAGVQIKDLDIAIEKDMMVIKGHRADPHPNLPAQAGKKYFYQECYWGPFSRKIVLPENVDTENADAQMDKGMLTIKIPKLTPETKTA